MTKRPIEINHHLQEETLLAYAAGTLGEHLNFVIATHLAVCPQCRAKAHEMDVAGASNLMQLAPMTLKATALDDIMARLDDDFMMEKPVAANKAVTTADDAEIPAPLRPYLSQGLDNIAWRSMAPGIKSFPLEDIKAGRGSIRLLKIAPGVTIPEHSHDGTELTLILRGSFSDEVGRFKAGDIADLSDDVDHQPIADTAEDCICLIATQAPLRFKGMVPKLMQYFVGM